MMVDIETLSTRVTARVLQVAVVVFDSRRVIDERMWLMDPQRQHTRHVDISTLSFWLRENPSRLQSLIDQGDTSIDDLHSDLLAMRDKYKPEGWWANSPSFDLVILEDLFKSARLVSPWSFRQAFDVRTLSYLTGRKLIKAEAAKQHDALNDALAQARWVINVVSQ